MPIVNKWTIYDNSDYTEGRSIMIAENSQKKAEQLHLILNFGKITTNMKVIKRDPMLEKIHKGILKAYKHIPAELEYERKQKENLKELQS